MTTSTILHAEQPEFKVNFTTAGRRFVGIKDEDGNEIGAFLTDAQALDLASAIQTAVFTQVLIDDRDEGMAI